MAPPPATVAEHLRVDADDEGCVSQGSLDRIVEACCKLAPRFVWLEVGPDDAADWLRALALRRMPVAIVPPFASSLDAYDAALNDPEVGSLPIAIALPRLYLPGLGRLLALARNTDHVRIGAVEGRLVARGVRELSQGVEAREAHDALLASVEEAVTLLSRLGCDPAAIAVDTAMSDRYFDLLRLTSDGVGALAVDLSLVSEASAARSGEATCDFVRLSGARWSLEWRLDEGGEHVIVDKAGVRHERVLSPEPWLPAFERAFERQIAGEAAGWVTLTNHRAEFARARSLTHSYLYEQGREQRRRARQRSRAEVEALGPFWAGLASFPTAQAGHRPVLVANPEQCRAIARPIGRDFRVLLVRAPATLASENAFPPIGLAQLATAAAAIGATTTVVDLAPVAAAYATDERSPVTVPVGVLGRELALRLGDARFDLAGVSWSDPLAWDGIRGEIVPLLRKHAPRLVLGGRAAGRFPIRDFEQGLVDFVLEGEAELGLVALLRHLVEGYPASDVPGLLQRGDYGSRFSHVVVPPFEWPGVPCYDGVDLAAYSTTVPGLRTPFLPYQTSRGCPYACAFCADESSHKVRERPASHIVRDLRALSDRYGVHDFFFLDNLLNVNERFVQAFLAAMEAAELGIRFVDCARPNGVDDETLLRLRRVGCTQLTFGVDAASDSLLKLMNKKLTVAEAERTLRGAKAAGIDAVVNLITAMPGETDADFEDGLRFVDRMRPYVRGFRPMPYNFTAGSPIYNEPHRFGLWRRADRFDVVGGDTWRRHREVRRERYRRLVEVVGDSKA